MIYFLGHKSCLLPSKSSCIQVPNREELIYFLDSLMESCGRIASKAGQKKNLGGVLEGDHILRKPKDK